ncbi:MAG: hypothetical protein R2822_21975 [Spirosomataceae bacterium]
MTIEKFLTRGFYLLATASIYDAQYTPRDGISATADSMDDLCKMYCWAKSGKQEESNQYFCGQFGSLWAGGNRYVPIDLAQSQKRNTTVRIYEQAYQAQLPPYFRLIPVSVIQKTAKEPLRRFLLTFRIFSIEPISYNLITTIPPDLSSLKQLGLVPVLNWRVEF